MYYRSARKTADETAKPYKAGKSVGPFKYKVGGGKKAVATYSALVNACRVGAIQDYYYGTRSDVDDTIVFVVDGVEYAKADLAGVLAAVTSALEAAGIVSVETGDAFCGYVSMTVTYADGAVLCESYDGVKVQCVEVVAALAAAA